MNAGYMDTVKTAVESRFKDTNNKTADKESYQKK